MGVFFNLEMHIEELKVEDSELGTCDSNSVLDVDIDCEGGDLVTDSGSKKRALVGVGARVLFYPTLLYNIVRNRMEPEFHWWDKVDEVNVVSLVSIKDLCKISQNSSSVFIEN